MDAAGGGASVAGHALHLRQKSRPPILFGEIDGNVAIPFNCYIFNKLKLNIKNFGSFEKQEKIKKLKFWIKKK